MPAIGPVYQPTTYNVGYEPQSEWQPPRPSRFSKFVHWVQSEKCGRLIFLGVSCIIILFILFVVLDFVLYLIFGYNLIKSDDQFYTIILYTGFIIAAIACLLALVILYMRFIRNKPLYFWPFLRKDGLVRQMSSQCRNGQTMVLNPSTDLLVTPAQYGPVMEAPPTMHEEDETRNLMCNDTKEMNEEHEDRPNDTDPRIVLRPPDHRDDL